MTAGLGMFAHRMMGMTGGVMSVRGVVARGLRGTCRLQFRGISKQGDELLELAFHEVDEVGVILGDGGGARFHREEGF